LSRTEAPRTSPRRQGEEKLRRSSAPAGIWRDALLRRLLAVADVSAVLTGTLAFRPGAATALWSAVFVPAWVLLAKLHGLYDRDQRTLRHLTVDELPKLFTWAATGTAALVAFLALVGPGALGVGRAAEVWATTGAAAVVLRSLARLAWRRITPPARTRVIGSGPLAAAARRKLELFPDIHAQVVGDEGELTASELRDVDDWLHDLDRVIVASQTVDGDDVERLVAACRRGHVKLALVPPVRGLFGTAIQLSHLGELPVVVYGTWDISRSTTFLKRTIDVAVSAIALVVLDPLLVLVALAVRLSSHGPVLFRQTRVGLEGRTFLMLKFRTMVANAEELLPGLVAIDSLTEPMFKLRDDPRVTPVGRVLRRLSLDELPQLWNVLRGDMSLVGPRPEEERLVVRYAPEHLVRVQVKPGLTGPMQVSGRGSLSLEERLAVERDYIENLSVGRDLRILALTVAALFSGRGAF
jgi:exopolysaccharide biosynthesis polyprenyl glycosylphosphotransferase